MKPLRMFVIGLMSIATSPLVAAPTDDFVTTWKTDNPGTSNPTSITVPMMGGPYDADWDNDGVFDQFGITDAVTHDFGVAGTYTIRIFGSYDSIRFADGGDKDKILSLDQWGTGSWSSMESAFRGVVNLLVPATDTPDFFGSHRYVKDVLLCYLGQPGYQWLEYLFSQRYVIYVLLD